MSSDLVWPKIRKIKIKNIMIMFPTIRGVAVLFVIHGSLSIRKVT